MDFFNRMESEEFSFTKKEECTIQFIFGGVTYAVEEFDFRQGSNLRNKSDKRIYDGLLTIIISNPLDEHINSWMLNSYQKRDGQFTIQRKCGENTSFNIIFHDGYCAGYQREINSLGTGLLTTLIILPRIVQIDNNYCFTNEYMLK